MQRITVVMFGVDNIVLPPALASAPTLPPLPKIPGSAHGINVLEAGQ